MEISSSDLSGGARVVFLIVLGLSATLMGVLTLTNFRGMRDDLVVSPADTGRVWRLKWIGRIGAVVFTIAGPIIAVYNIVQSTRPGFHFDPFARSWPAGSLFGLFAGGCTAVNLWQGWREYTRSRGADRAVLRRMLPITTAAGVVAIAGFASGYLVPTLGGMLVFAGTQVAFMSPAQPDNAG